MFAYIVIGLLVWTRTGVAPATYVEYYQGNEAAEIYGKTFAELLELTHFHLFSYPVFILIQGHIFLLCSWRRPVKAWIVLACFAGAAIYIAAPWLVFYGGSAWGFAQILGRALLVPPLILFIAVPLYEMWFKSGTPTVTSPDY